MSAIEAPDLSSPEFVADPYPFYTQLRERGPLHRARGTSGAWLVPRHADVVAALDDPRLSASRHKQIVGRLPIDVRDEFADLDRRLGRWMTFLPRAEHDRLRTSVRGGFSSSTLAAMRVRMHAIAEQLIDDLHDRREMEFLSEFAKPFSVRVVAALLGVDPADSADHAQFLAWSDALVSFMGPRPTRDAALRAQSSVLAMDGYFRARLTEFRSRSGLVGLLLDIAGDSCPMSVDQLVAQCSMLLVTGHELPGHLLANGLLTLLRHPEQLARLRVSPSLGPTAVREMLRFEPPPKFIVRQAVESFQWHGEAIAAGDLVYCLVGAANRDPVRFSEPERFDIARTPGGQLGFGSGAYACLGAQLGLMGAEVAFATLFRRLPELRLVEPPLWTNNLSIRALDRLLIAR